MQTQDEGLTVSGILVILAILGALGLVFWWLQSSEPELLTGLIVGLLPSVILIYQRNQDRKENHKKWLLQNKEACAIELADIFTSFATKSVGSSTEQRQRKMLARFKNLRSALVVWGSPNLLGQLEAIETQPANMPLEKTICLIERFLRTIRKELKHNDSKLKPGAVLASLIGEEEKGQIYEACKGEKY